MVEGGRQGFETIPQSIYWAVVTVTTVGYGDVSPITPLVKFFAVVLMLASYSIIAVPTGIVNAEMRNKRKNLEQICNRCGNDDIDDDARYCKRCGKKIILKFKKIKFIHKVSQNHGIIKTESLSNYSFCTGILIISIYFVFPTIHN